MAKVKGPLFSMNASGKLGKALVYMQWKGIDDVRSYVVPANPRTTAQMTQRGYLSDGVAFWHDTSLTGDDRVAWDVLAGTLSRPMSGFNAVVQHVINIKLAGQTPVVMSEGSVSSTEAGKAAVSVKATTGLDVIVKYGERPGSLIYSADLSETTGTYSATITGLTSGKVYYFQFVVTTTASNLSKTGIYSCLIT